MPLDWKLVSLGATVVHGMFLHSREKRRQREAVEQAEREHGRGAALRVEAEHALWSDAKIERIAEEIGRLEGSEAAARFRTEVAEARAGTPFYVRPVRSLWAIPIALVLILVVMAVVVLLYR